MCSGPDERRALLAAFSTTTLDNLIILSTDPGFNIDQPLSLSPARLDRTECSKKTHADYDRIDKSDP